MTITLKELLQDNKFDGLIPEHQENLLVLLKAISAVRDAYGHPMTVTSCIRTKEKQIAVYAAKGITDPSKIPMQSCHLKAAAVDISDQGLVLTKWLKDNPEVLEDAGLWCEADNSNWVHAQIFPPKSGSRWFKP